MFKTIFLSLLMVQTLYAACGKGCLKCADKSSTDNTKVCYLCDSNSNYYLKTDQTCALSDLTNCSVIQQDNTCGFCSTNYFLDSATSKCVAVDSLKKVTNCLFYDSLQNCRQCVKNFLKSNNTCNAITTPIANCMINSSQTECESCDTNYYLAEDKKSCKQLPSDCLGYSLTQCKSCKTGFIINYNKYQKNMYKWTTNQERDGFYLLLFIQKTNIRVEQSLDFCETTVAENCATFTTFDQCGTCISGYYLDQTSLKCTKFPEPIIPNCNIYAFDDIIRWKYKCVSCKDNFYLKDKTTCTAVDQSDTNCTSYDTTANTSRCIQCVNTKLLTNGTCTTDRTTINNCSTYYPSVNKCFTCSDSYTKNNDETACKKITPNCLVPKSFTVDSTENILCDKCKDEYFLASDNTCSKGAKNCNQYSSETVCLNCLNQFYSTPSCDNKHPNITNCNIYSQSTTNRCLKCSPMQVPIYLNQKCKAYTNISNCEVHDLQNVNTIKCTKCNKGYILAQDSLSCSLIPVSENCYSKNGNNCTQCKEGYYLVQNLTTNAYSCISIPANITTNCSAYDQILGVNVKWLLSQSCNECQQGYIGLYANTCILKTNIPYLTNNTIPTNCLHMNNAGQCLKCEPNYYLSSGQCSQTCNNTITWVSGDQINICVTGTAGYLLQDTEALMCKSTHYTILKQDGIGSNLNWWKTSISSTDSLVANIADKQQSVNCELPPNATYFVNGVSTLANQITSQSIGKDRVVRKFIDDQANSVKNYITVNCGWQKKGNISISASTDATKYLNCESSISTDFSSERLGGVPTFWSNLFNVHKCTNSSQSQVRIPVLVAVINAADNVFKEWKQYNFARDTYVPESNDSTGTGIFCLDVASPTTIMNGLQTSTVGNIADFSGCGLGLLDLSLFTNKSGFNSTGYDITQANSASRSEKEQLKCLACKPGYKSNPDYISGNIYARKCTAITNCNQNATQNIFDACSQCNTGYTWSSNNSGEIDFSVCVKIPSNLTNCIGYNNVGGANGDLGRCIVCDKGYQITMDGLCEQITLPSCVGNYYSYYDSLGSNVNNYIYQNGYGCSNCGDNMILQNSSSQCVKLPSLLANTSRNYPSTAIVITDNQTRGDGNLIDKCDRYNIENICAQCLSGYTKTQDGKQCKQTPSTGGLAKCVSLENDGTTCHECQNIDGYGLVTGQGCILQKIDGCSVYNYNNPRASVQCITCQETYYQFNTTQCKKGKVPFCRFYGDDPLICHDCMSGYWLLKSSNIDQSSYCLPKDTSIGCAYANFSIESDSTPGNGTYNYLAVSCNSCESQYAYVISTEDTDTKAKCLPISYSGTCQTIDSNFYLNDDGQSFKCTKCADTEYLSSDDLNYVCKPRTNQDEERINCLKFSLTSELCIECQTGAYLNKNQTGCTLYPTGLYACVEYDNALKCTKCNFDHYLQNNGCIKVASPEPVVNCNEYQSVDQCKLCDSGYFLNNNICELQSTNLNCLTFEAKDSCKTCPDEYKLTATNGKNSCVKVTKPSNCDTVDVSTAKCTQCVKNYYVNSTGQCTQSEIVNCAVNNTDTTCKRCEPGYALSGNATKCLSGTDLASNCYEGVMAATPICSLCKAGYKFKDGTCQKNSNATIENGCFDEDTSKKTCIFCISGWSMGTDGKCTNNNPTPDNTKYGAIQLISLLFALIFFQVI